MRDAWIGAISEMHSVINKIKTEFERATSRGNRPHTFSMRLIYTSCMSLVLIQCMRFIHEAR